MIPRKKRIVILISIIAIAIVITLSSLVCILLKTDTFKSNEELFAKYFIQNFNMIDILKTEELQENGNKYTSKLQATTEYIENIGTSDENKNNAINDVDIKIESDVDETNNYIYKDISIQTEQDKLLGLEYLKQDEKYGIRLNGIQQFVSSDNEGKDLLKEFKLEDIEKTFSQLNINSIFNFTEEEKQSLTNTFMNTIKLNISKEKYYKQTKTLITIGNEDIKANSYYIKLTFEEFNNLYIKILEEIMQNDIILSKIESIEKEINKIYTINNIKEEFIDKINEKIEEIQSNNIGSDEVRITVYENNKKTIRTSIERSTSKTTFDLQNSQIKINITELDESEKQTIIQLMKQNNEKQENIVLNKEEIQNNETINKQELNINQNYENDKLDKNIQIKIETPKYSGNFNIVDNIEYVQQFENEITLDKDNVEINSLEEEQANNILNILSENIKQQTNNLNSIVTKEDYTNMLQKLEIINKSSVQLPSEGQVSEIERKRFNSQFEFFASEDLTKENITDLMKIVENNFEEMKILSKDGNIEEFDIDKCESPQESSEYIKNISEILIFIKENSRNERKKENVTKFLDKTSIDKYDVSIQYDDNGLARLIRVKTQERNS